jgi:hypothetical protein
VAADEWWLSAGPGAQVFRRLTAKLGVKPQSTQAIDLSAERLCQPLIAP